MGYRYLKFISLSRLCFGKVPRRQGHSYGQSFSFRSYSQPSAPIAFRACTSKSRLGPRGAWAFVKSLSSPKHSKTHVGTQNVSSQSSLRTPRLQKLLISPKAHNTSSRKKAALYWQFLPRSLLAIFFMVRCGHDLSVLTWGLGFEQRMLWALAFSKQSMLCHNSGCIVFLSFETKDAVGPGFFKSKDAVP